MRISDWSSYVCSSDLACRGGRHCTRFARVHRLVAFVVFLACGMLYIRRQRCRAKPVQQVQHAFEKLDLEEIGRATCRARVCQYVEISGVEGSLKKNKHTVKGNEAVNDIKTKQT